MATNCLITKLKGVVDNDNLPKLNELKIYTVNATDALDNWGKHNFSISNGTLSNDGTVVTVQNKLQMGGISAYYGNLIYLNFNELKYCTGLIRLNVANQTYSGDLKNLPTSISYFQVGGSTNTPYPIDIMDIAHLTNLTCITNLSAYSMDVVGNVEDFVAKQIELGRTSCTNLLIGIEGSPSLAISTNIKFNNTPITVQSYVSWNWDGTSANITVTPYTA